MEWKLKYRAPASSAGEGDRFWAAGGAWERESLPLGNGFFGANLFGRTDVERIQISEPTLANPYYTPKTVPRHGSAAAGMNSLADLFLELGHEGVENYERSLDLETATVRVSYTAGGVSYEREAFTSHPDRLLAMRLTAKGGVLSFTLRAKIPFLGEYTVEEGDGLSKTGWVRAEGDSVTLGGEMGYYGIEYYGYAKVVAPSGTVSTKGDGIAVENAKEAWIFFCCDTNYALSEEVFLLPAKEKLRGRHVDGAAVVSLVERAAALSFETLRERHVKDYGALFSRVSLELGQAEAEETDALRELYYAGKCSPYFEALLFQYGRYLLISSSRTRLPAHLQGIWNAYADSPWSAGYWHNINVQMNYWLSGPAALSECFLPYAAYARAYMEAARRSADRFVSLYAPKEAGDGGENGWIIGTGGWPYVIDGLEKIGHSGPGTGAFTSLLFWDHYDYTGDEAFLREFAYPALRGMSLFFTRILEEVGEKMLIPLSASPENEHGGGYYHTVGCAFDQQMVYENMKRTVEAAKILGVEDGFTRRLEEILPRLDPVLLGDDGQVKEYREETGYASIGEPHHRHVSHLVGLYPGTLINKDTPSWLEGAKKTLTLRGDESTGWAVAHRLLLWARTGTPHKCRDLIRSFITRNLLPNLWCSHPPFQIDGNFGYTAAVCEMLLQSHGGCIALLPALPKEWKRGAFRGLVARGGFSVDCAWEEGRITRLSVRASKAGTLRIRLPRHLIPKGTREENGTCLFPLGEGEILSLRAE